MSDSQKELKDRIKFSPCGGYLLWGDEEYLTRYYLDAFRKLIRDDGFFEFNHTRIDYKRGGMETLSEAVMMMPLMASRRMVEVWGLNILSLDKEEEKRLCEIASSFSRSDTIFVIVCRSGELVLDRTASKKKIVKELGEHLFFAELPRQSETKLVSWLDKQFSSASIRISDKLCRKLIEMTGADMTLLKLECDKLQNYAEYSGMDEISETAVELLVKPNTEEEIYRFTDALLSRRAESAIEIFYSLKRQRVAPLVICAAASRSLSNLAMIKCGGKELLEVTGMQDWQINKQLPLARSVGPRFLERAIRLFGECDKKLKSTGEDGYLLVEQTLFKILCATK